MSSFSIWHWLVAIPFWAGLFYTTYLIIRGLWGLARIAATRIIELAFLEGSTVRK